MRVESYKDSERVSNTQKIAFQFGIKYRIKKIYIAERYVCGRLGSWWIKSLPSLRSLVGLKE